MAQPPYIPTHSGVDKQPSASPSYVSPAHIPGRWRPNRPGDITDEGNPSGPGFGNQGPDQGYILWLAKNYSGSIFLKAGELRSDVLKACCQLALKRASIKGRAPVQEDLEVSLSIFGYPYENPPAELVDFRRRVASGGVGGGVGDAGDIGEVSDISEVSDKGSAGDVGSIDGGSHGGAGSGAGVRITDDAASADSAGNVESASGITSGTKSAGGVKSMGGVGDIDSAPDLVADLVSSEVLMFDPTQIQELQRSGWRSVFSDSPS